MQVNYRGSTGFGKRFLHAGDKQWGVGTMQHDLTVSRMCNMLLNAYRSPIDVRRLNVMSISLYALL